MPRAIWKGEIAFGLVHVPVSLYSAERKPDINLHMVDSRNHARVRYERVNAETGEEVPWDAIVKGYEYDDSGYVLLSEEELQQVQAQLTRTIEVEDFVDADAIEPLYFDRPYYLEPGKRGEKGYSLLREALRLTGKAGIAQVVIRSRNYLCALMPADEALVLFVLRYAQEIRPLSQLELPAVGDTRISKREADLAVHLIEEMTTAWDPERYHDEYREKLTQFVENKVERGEMEAVTEPGEQDDEDDESDDDTVVDLMAYLKKSVAQAEQDDSGKSSGKKAGSRKGATRKTAARKSSPRATKKSAPKKKRARQEKRSSSSSSSSSSSGKKRQSA